METTKLHTDIDKLKQKAETICEDILEMELTDVSSAYAQFIKKRTAEKRKYRVQYIMKYAAMLAVPLMITTVVLSYLYFGTSDNVQQFAEVKALNGMIVKYELPDHSIVWLNSGSSLRYPTKFKDNERAVALNGEAYFEVQANKEKPFYVNTPQGLSVYVYGTHFNISAYENGEDIETLLEEGRLKVRLPHSASELDLNPGEYVSYNKLSQQVIKTKVDIEEKLAWKDGKLVFRNTRLEDVFKTLERHFNVIISYHNHTGKEYRYRATFRDETLPQILEYLSKSATLKWSIEKLEDNKNSRTKKVVVDLY